MWHDYGYFEGDKLAKVYDLKLMKRLGRYCRPFLGILLLIAFLILAATAADLLLPYLTKIAIDRYIVVSARQVNIHPDLPPAIAEICDKYREYWEPSGKQGLYFLPNVKSSRIDLRDMARLRQAGVISEVPYYLIDIQSAAAMETARGHPELFEIFPNAAAIKVSDLARLDRSALLSIREKDLVGLGYLALLSIALLLVGYVFDFGQVILLEYTGQKLTLDLRQQLLEHVLNQSMAFHDRQSTGRLVARLTNDIQNLSEMIKTVAVTLFKDAFILVGIIIILVRTDLRLALVTFTVLPPILIITMVFRRKARDLFRRLRVIVGRINTAFSETIAGIRVVQAFRREKESAREFEELNHESFLAGLGQILVFATFMPIIEVFSAVALGLILWVGGLSVLQETITLGTVVVFISYSRKFFQPIRDMAEKFNILQSAMASLERIFGLMDTHQALPRVPAPVRTEKTKGSIVFENVRFAYKPNEPVLKDVSFEVKPGTTLAIVGATGSGKTSIINLLLRFYDLQSGRILVDGLDIRELDLVAHRSRMGLVMQDVFLFAGTIRENIALSQDHIPPDRIMAAARSVGAGEFIESLPRSYDERLGEGGLSLSVGQRQLLSFARVLVHDPGILILDEATAFIDSETEQKIEQALGRVTAGRTSIIIAHRLSTIQRADRILVLHRGRVAEFGSHGELMARQDLYFRMQKFQFAANGRA